MPFVPAEKCAKVAIEGTWASQKVVSTLWFQFTSEPSQSDLLALATYVFTGLWPVFKSAVGSTYTLNQITATRQQNASDIQAVYVPSTGNVGTGGGTTVSLNSAWCFSPRTILRGRSFRGRLYWPAIEVGVLLSAGLGDAAVLGPLAAGLLSALTSALPTGWTWVVASHFAAKVPRSLAVLTPIVAVIVDTALDSMRRRLVGRGT